MLEALREAEDCRYEFQAFDSALRSEHPTNVEKWEKEVEEYAADKEKSCPYMITSKCMFAGVILLHWF